MADMARIQRANLTIPEENNAKLAGSEYSSEFANIKRDLHPHYFLSYKTMGDIELEDGEYAQAIERYEDTIDLFERSFQRRTYGDAENHYVSFTETQRQYNESLVNLSFAYLAHYKQTGISGVGDLNVCIQTVHKLLEQPELSPAVLRKAHLILGDAHYIRGSSYSQDRKRKSQAVADFEEVIRTYHIVEIEYPKLDIMRTSNLAQTYLALDMPYEAVRILERQKTEILIDQIERSGLHQYELDLTNRMLGSIHRNLKNYTEAIASYRSIQSSEFKFEMQTSIKNLQKLEALGN
jgi:tetratricopeptide (TPR) repeat protein